MFDTSAFGKSEFPVQLGAFGQLPMPISSPPIIGGEETAKMMNEWSEQQMAYNYQLEQLKAQADARDYQMVVTSTSIGAVVGAGLAIWRKKHWIFGVLGGGILGAVGYQAYRRI